MPDEFADQPGDLWGELGLVGEMRSSATIAAGGLPSRQSANKRSRNSSILRVVTFTPAL